ncbi:DNA-binding transcriptional LysR family regulator [Actinoplanes campanulatus]|uniref:DNA-binding transcriptional LysR family regulator n=1 Tax=Actinoplanes campanulatus TaxID=113559 RepID=A0A7W5FH12_9ACTN|nr:LysR family transcriptional regulator [Actinoplanes campanulatus]MBB3098005.1 DNA-binding transcriptional LysR family regulator [Actinoplanes campanulatus]GGN31876.1 LysR family transcriptional regulator [Actinoplanes campanulatus]GID41392.1 LysR family transcriptional regulator [Actinoplanes campanulatus]
MTLGGTDLNLLLFLRVLLEEGNVTRAGARLEVGQPAMSAALAKLRRRFDDELLVRAGRDYELTPFARDLLPEVQRAVRLIARALELEDHFDAATSERTFRLAMSDYAIAVLHEPLVRLLRATAPGVRLSIERIGPKARTSSRTLLEYDALVAPLGFGFPGQRRMLWRDRMVLIADRKHPRLAAGGLTLADLAELPHAVATFGPGILTPVDRVFGEHGIDRRIVLQVPGFLPLAFVIEGTEMVAVVPERLARLHLAPGGPITVIEPPFGEVLLAEGYWYGRDRLADPAHRWLFARFDALAAELKVTSGSR